MQDKRIARRCKACGEPMPVDAFLCAKCGKATSEIYTRLGDPRDMRRPRYEAKRAKRPQGSSH